MESRIAPVRSRGKNDRRVVEALMAVGLILVGLAIVKPWDLGPRRATGTPRDDAGVRPSQGTPMPSTTPNTDDLVARFCLAPSGWRIYSLEQWADQRIRSWKAVQPAVAASGPTDPRIPIVPVVARSVVRAGWCAPVDPHDRPPSASRVTVYARFDDVQDASLARIEPQQVQPTAGASVLGAAYAPPVPPGQRQGAVQADWPAGTYVVRVATLDGKYQRWLGFRIEIFDPGQ
jgi:hypothetical protein